MNLRWSLEPLYKSFDAPEFSRDFQLVEESVETFKGWVRENLNNYDEAGRKIEEYVERQNKFSQLALRVYAFASLSQSVEARNEQALKVLEKIGKIRAELIPFTVVFQKWLLGVQNLDEVISSSPLLEEHDFILTSIVQKGKYLLSEKEERVIAQLNTTGAAAWTKLQQLLTSTLMVDMKVGDEVKKLPLSVVRGMAYDKDPVTRKTAYEVELQSYTKIDESVAACLNGIKGQVITVSKLRGFTSPLEQTLLASRMEASTLDAMMTAMKESLPAFRRYFKAKAKLLGHENGLPFYDLFAPIGEVDLTYTYEEARDFIVENFGRFSKSMADLAERAFNDGWIDAEPRDGKRGGAFCFNLKMIEQSRVLTNYNGSFSDVGTLAHELGHAYHGNCLLGETHLNSEYPMPLAETASIFAETIVNEAAIGGVGPEEAFAILENSISGHAQVIVDIMSRFLFESEVFKRREAYSLSVNELKEIMINAQKETYGDGLDPEFLHPYMWLNKPHYYSADLNFYNFPYAFGLLFAKGIYAEYLRRGEEFVPELDRLLAATGKMSITEVAKMVDIDVNSIDFWRASIGVIVEEIERFLELCEKR